MIINKSWINTLNEYPEQEILRGCDWFDGDTEIVNANAILLNGTGYTIGLVPGEDITITAKLTYPKLNEITDMDVFLINKNSKKQFISKNDISIQDIANLYANIEIINVNQY